MLGTYPIFIDGEETGSLQVRREGLMTVFEAQCADTGELLRLSAYGESEGYLGVMMPDGAGRMHLHKRLSRAALERFPGEIRFAGRAGLPQEKKEEARESEMPAPEPQEQQAQEQEEICAPEIVIPSEPVILWRHSAGGAMLGAQGEKRYLAVPLKEGVAPMQGNYQQREIDGRAYAVFEIRNGRIL